MHLNVSVLFVLCILLGDSHLDLWILSNSSHNASEQTVKAGRLFSFLREYVRTDTFCVEKWARLNYTWIFICISKLFFSTLNLLRMWEISACLCDISITSFSWTHTLRVVILVKWLQERFSLCKEKRQLSHIHTQTISLFFRLLLSIIYWHGSGCRFPWKFLSVAVAKWSCDCVSRPAAACVLNDFISLCDAGWVTNTLSCLIISLS